MQICKKCGKELEDEALFCSGCGNILINKCKKCGKVLKDEDLFCSACGHCNGNSDEQINGEDVKPEVDNINKTSDILKDNAGNGKETKKESGVVKVAKEENGGKDKRIKKFQVFKHWSVKKTILASVASFVCLLVLITAIVAPITISESKMYNYKKQTTDMYLKLKESATNLDLVGDVVYSCWYDEVYNGGYGGSISLAIDSALRACKTECNTERETKDFLDKTLAAISAEKVPKGMEEQFKAIKMCINKHHEYYDFVVDVSGSFNTFSSRKEEIKKEYKAALTHLQLEMRIS